MENPCKNCPDKGCGKYHDECERYQGYKQYLEEKREMIRKAKGGRQYLKPSTFKSRTNGMFKNHMK